VVETLSDLDGGYFYYQVNAAQTIWNTIGFIKEGETSETQIAELDAHNLHCCFDVSCIFWIFCKSLGGCQTRTGGHLPREKYVLWIRAGFRDRVLNPVHPHWVASVVSKFDRNKA
jgi:hypothetical protein